MRKSNQLGVKYKNLHTFQETVENFIYMGDFNIFGVIDANLHKKNGLSRTNIPP